MANADIQSWVKGDQDFYTGLTLYLKYGKSSTLKRLLSKKGETNYNSEKLLYELGKLADLDVAISIKKQAPRVKKTVQAIPVQPAMDPPVPAAAPTLPPVFSDIELPEVDFSKLPDQLKHETMQRVKLYKQTWILQFRLNEQQTDEKRLALAKEIITNMDEVNRLWERIDHYLEHGVIPAQKPEAKPKSLPTDPVSLVKRQMNLRTYISRGRKRLQVLVNAVKRNKLEDDINKWDLELAEIDKKLNS